MMITDKISCTGQSIWSEGIPGHQRTCRDCFRRFTAEHHGVHLNFYIRNPCALGDDEFRILRWGKQVCHSMYCRRLWLTSLLGHDGSFCNACHRGLTVWHPENIEGENVGWHYNFLDGAWRNSTWVHHWLHDVGPIREIPDSRPSLSYCSAKFSFLYHDGLDLKSFRDKQYNNISKFFGDATKRPRACDHCVALFDLLRLLLTRSHSFRMRTLIVL